MKRAPAVSAIIPTFNRREFAAEAVRSVLSQTFDDFELIVVDDGSEDSTAAFLEETFADPRLRVIRQGNRGVSAARNTGVGQSRGEFLAFLDSDDLWTEEKLRLSRKALEEHPEAALVYTEEIWHRRGKWANPCSHHAKRSGWIFPHCIPLCIISPSSAVIRREAFMKAGGFDESLPACEDYDLWLRLTSRHSVHLVEEKLIIKRNGHEGQLSAIHFAQDRYRVAALWKIALDEEVRGDWRIEALKAIAEKSHIVAEGALKRGNVERSEIFSHSRKEALFCLAKLQG
ncbi:glycosyltransferase [bacterium]|nr:MAG: glycosyltransferase [bacterium]